MGRCELEAQWVDVSWRLVEFVTYCDPYILDMCDNALEA